MKKFLFVCMFVLMSGKGAIAQSSGFDPSQRFNFANPLAPNNFWYYADEDRQRQALRKELEHKKHQQEPDQSKKEPPQPSNPLGVPYSEHQQQNPNRKPMEIGALTWVFLLLMMSVVIFGEGIAVVVLWLIPKRFSYETRTRIFEIAGTTVVISIMIGIFCVFMHFLNKIEPNNYREANAVSSQLNTEVENGEKIPIKKWCPFR